MIGCPAGKSRTSQNDACGDEDEDVDDDVFACARMSITLFVGPPDGAWNRAAGFVLQYRDRPEEAAVAFMVLYLAGKLTFQPEIASL